MNDPDALLDLLTGLGQSLRALPTPALLERDRRKRTLRPVQSEDPRVADYLKGIQADLGRLGRRES